MGTFSSMRGDYGLRIENELEAFFDEKIKESPEHGLFSETSIMKLREVCLRNSRRLGSVFSAIAAAGMGDFSRAEEKDIIRASVSIELLKGFISLHNKALENISSIKNKDKEDEASALILGNLAFSYSVRAVQKVSLEKKGDFLDGLQKLSEKAIHGEKLWLSIRKKTIHETHEKELLDVLEMSLAPNMIPGSLKLGAVLAGLPHNDKNISILEDISSSLNLAFALKDEISGMFSTESELGRPEREDFERAKKTLLIKKVFNNLETGDEKNFLLQNFGHHISPRDFTQARNIIKGSEGFRLAKEDIRKNAEYARQKFNSLPLKNKPKKFFLDVCDHLRS